MRFKEQEYVKVPKCMYDETVACIKIYENLLRKYMGDEGFIKMSTDLAKEFFAKSISEIEDEDFKQFCVDHFEEITADPFEGISDDEA